MPVLALNGADRCMGRVKNLTVTNSHSHFRTPARAKFARSSHFRTLRANGPRRGSLPQRQRKNCVRLILKPEAEWQAVSPGASRRLASRK